MYESVRRGADQVRRWQQATPYLLRHAGEHAAAAGQLGELLQDGGYLTHAHPARLAPLLFHLTPEEAAGAGDVYRASYALHSRLSPAHRAQVLAVDAIRFHR